MRSHTRDIVAWCEGTQTLGADEYRAYDTAIQLIYLTEGPLPFNEKELAARCNMTPPRLRKSIASLIALHKIWIRDGRIYNLRVLMELSRALPECPEWDLTPDYGASPPERTSEARAANAGPSKTEAEAAFERFWAIRAPRTGGDHREPARRKFLALVASGITPETLEARMKRHIATQRSIGKLGTEFTPMTATWLNKQGAKDDAPQIDRQNVVQLDPARFTAEEWAPILRIYAMTHSWKTSLHGPEPGRLGCLVPGELTEPKKALG